MCTPAQPAWPGFAMGHIMKTLNMVNSSLVQAPMEEKTKLAHKLEDNLHCAKVSCSSQFDIISSGQVLAREIVPDLFYTHVTSSELVKIVK